MSQRIINDSFWTDSWIEDRDPSEKLIYLHLLTNPLCNIGWIYEIKLKRIAYETGYDRDTVNNILDRFVEQGKIIRCDDRIIIKNFAKNQSVNPNVKKGMQRIIDNLPHKVKALEGFGSLSHFTLLNLTLPNLTLLNSTLPKGCPTDVGEEELVEEELVEDKKKSNCIYKFDEFWALYPKKQKKLQTETKYKSLIKQSVVTHEKIMEWVTSYHTHIRKSWVEEKYIKQPTTWLNGWCRDDEYKIKLASPQKQTQPTQKVEEKEFIPADPEVIKASLEKRKQFRKTGIKTF